MRDEWPCNWLGDFGHFLNWRHSIGKLLQLVQREPPYLPQHLELSLKRQGSTVKPVPLAGRSMNSERPSNRVAVIPRLQPVLAREYFNPLHLTHMPFYRHIETKGEIKNKGTA